MWEEFKKFAFKGNVLDMAVGVIIGAAFGKIVSSLVSDMIMPIIGFFSAGMDFKSLKLVLSAAVMEGDKVIKPESAIMYGAFLQNVLDFFIIALSIFIFIRIINKAREKISRPEEKQEIAPTGPNETQLLTEIRDILKNKE